MWEKHCDVLTAVLSDSFLRLEKQIFNEYMFKGFNIKSYCKCPDISNYIGRNACDFLDFDHRIVFEFRGLRKKAVAMRVEVKIVYLDEVIPFCSDNIQIKLSNFLSKNRAVIKDDDYSYFLKVLEKAHLYFDFEIIDLALQNILTDDHILDYMMEKSLGRIPYENCELTYELDPWKQYVL